MLPLWEDAESSVHVVRLTEREEVEQLVHLFEKVAQSEGWQPPENALQPEMTSSVYFALEIEAQMVGGLQMVLPDGAGKLSYQSVWTEVAVPSRSAHIAILAFDEVFRGQQRYFWHVAIEMWRHCVGKGITTLFIEVTPRVLPIYQRLGWPLQIVGELREHWGEDCYLCTLGIPEVAEALLRKAEQSEYYREIIAQAFRVTMSRRGEREVVSVAVAG
jgi:hypothetical protein